MANISSLPDCFQSAHLTTLILAAALTIAGPSAADDRYFTYTYEPKVLPDGALEFEQWASARVGKESGIYSRWDLRSEIEYGLTDSLTTALYLNFKSLHVDNAVEDESEFEFEGISSEWKYKISDPTADAVGFLLYGEVTTNFNELELEQKLVVGKNLGPWVLAFNAVFEEEWEFEDKETEKEFVLEFTAGAAYRLSSSVSVGLELREKNVFPDFEEFEHAAFFVGPAIHFTTEKWWLTLTVLPQVVGLKGTEGGHLNLDEFERVEVRLILGIHF